jgi:ubiquitin-like protein Pup
MTPTGTSRWEFSRFRARSRLASRRRGHEGGGPWPNRSGRPSGPRGPRRRARRRPPPPPRLAEKRATIKKSIDEVIDDIDTVLEENAEEFVKSYVQRGGE